MGAVAEHDTGGKKVDNGDECTQPCHAGSDTEPEDLDALVARIAELREKWVAEHGPLAYVESEPFTLPDLPQEEVWTKEEAEHVRKYGILYDPNLLWLSDPATFLLRGGECFRRQLDAANSRALADWVGIDAIPEAGIWEPEQDERFVDAAIKFLSEGKAPTRDVQPAFVLYKEWLTQVWKQIKDPANEIEVSQEMRFTLARLLK